MTTTFLTPIEKPQGLTMKLAYFFVKKMFGKVLTPLKVHTARLPYAFTGFYTKIGQLDKKMQLQPELIFLLRQQVARVNICLFCIDIGRYAAIQAKFNPAKFDALDEYKTSKLFSAAERAALDYVTKLTVEKQMDAATFDILAEHFSEREICEIVYLVASEHVYNITNIGLNIHSDMLCDISKRSTKS